jgi:hypothetical protein
VTDDPPVAPEPEPVRPKLTDREPLADIQARLREESARGVQGGRIRRGRQV